MEKESISDSLEKTISFSDLENVATELTEVFLDKDMEEGILRDIPIVGTIVALSKTAKSVKDFLFLKKILSFLKESSKVSTEERLKAIEKINTSRKYRTKVGEKLLFIVDKCDDAERAEMFGRFFAYFLKGKISYDDFLRLSKATDNLILQDVLEFANADWKWKEIGSASHLVNSGLVEISSLEITVEDQWDHKASNKYIVDGTELSVTVTRIGELVREILKDNEKI